MHVLIYTDGSSKPNPGKTGWGAHGYRYALDGNKTRKLGDYNITNQGYKLKQEMADGDMPVWPIEFYDFAVYETRDGTNNLAELAAVVKVLEYFKGHELASITICTDSEYVRKGVLDNLDNWKNRDWKTLDGSPISNVHLWQAYLEHRSHYESINCPITLNWVKGHQNFGNIIADQLAKISVNIGTISTECKDYTITPGDVYAKAEVPKHPLMAFRRLFFSNQSRLDAGKYYLAEPVDGLESLGKRHSEAAYGVVHMDKADNIIECIKANHRTSSLDYACTVAARLDRIYDKTVYPYVFKYGNGCLVASSSKHKFGITTVDFIDGRNVTTELIPTGLSFIGMETLSLLEDILVRYTRNLIETPDAGSNVLGSDYYITDITDHFFDQITKKQSITHALKPIFGVGIKNTTISVGVDLHGKSNQLAVMLTFGGDIPHRNNMKHLEDINPRVKLVVWAESNILYRYACIVIVDGAISIWSNYYSNQILLTS